MSDKVGMGRKKLKEIIDWCLGPVSEEKLEELHQAIEKQKAGLATKIRTAPPPVTAQKPSSNAHKLVDRGGNVL